MNATLSPVAVALKAATKKTIVFDPHFEINFSTDGVTENASGTSGYNPGVVSVVMYNASVSGSTAATKVVNDEIAAAAEISEGALLIAIKKHYCATGRVTVSWDRAMGDEQCDGETPW